MINEHVEFDITNQIAAKPQWKMVGFVHKKDEEVEAEACKFSWVTLILYLLNTPTPTPTLTPKLDTSVVLLYKSHVQHEGTSS